MADTTPLIALEVKQDTPERLAAIAGQPTRNFLFADEFNQIPDKINLLWQLLKAVNFDVAQIVDGSNSVDLGTITGSFLTPLNATVDNYRSPFFVKYRVGTIDYIQAFTGQTGTYGIGLTLLTADDFYLIWQSDVVNVGTNISRQFFTNEVTFDNVIGDYYGTVTAPRTGQILFTRNGDLILGVAGGIAVVYYINATLSFPTFTINSGTFAPNVLNKIYLERDSEGFITANIINEVVVPPADTTPPSNIGTLTIINEGVIPADTTPPSTIGTLTITNN
jgi:hypothetical protein